LGLGIITAANFLSEEQGAKTIAKDPDPPVLTERQKEILKFVTNGLRNSDVARQLGISTDAVKQHLNAICNKLGAVNRAEAIAIALRKQLLKI
jgi:DNA-binding NarL/FixJ family response regulator